MIIIPWQCKVKNLRRSHRNGLQNEWQRKRKKPGENHSEASRNGTFVEILHYFPHRLIYFRLRRRCLCRNNAETFLLQNGKIMSNFMLCALCANDTIFSPFARRSTKNSVESFFRFVSLEFVPAIFLYFRHFLSSIRSLIPLWSLWLAESAKWHKLYATAFVICVPHECSIRNSLVCRLAGQSFNGIFPQLCNTITN